MGLSCPLQLWLHLRQNVWAEADLPKVDKETVFSVTDEDGTEEPIVPENHEGSVLHTWKQTGPGSMGKRNNFLSGTMKRLCTYCTGQPWRLDNSSELVSTFCTVQVKFVRGMYWGTAGWIILMVEFWQTKSRCSLKGGGCRISFFQLVFRPWMQSLPFLCTCFINYIHMYCLNCNFANHVDIFTLNVSMLYFLLFFS